MICLRNNKSRKGRKEYSVAERRLEKDLEELTLKRYTAGIADFFVSLSDNRGDFISLPVSLQIKPNTQHLYQGA